MRPGRHPRPHQSFHSLPEKRHDPGSRSGGQPGPHPGMETAIEGKSRHVDRYQGRSPISVNLKYLLLWSSVFVGNVRSTESNSRVPRSGFLRGSVLLFTITILANLAGSKSNQLPR